MYACPNNLERGKMQEERKRVKKRERKKERQTERKKGIPKIKCLLSS